MKQYAIFDLRGGLMSDNNVITARSPIEAVRKFYRNVKRVKNGNIVVNHRYCYEGDKRK